jgi:hypothetical protein
MQKIETIPDLFYVFGGKSSFARLLGVRPSTVSEMSRRNSIPIKYWPTIINSEKGQELMISSYILLRLNLGDKA